MTTLAILLAVGCQLFNVAGQLLLKHAMEPADPATPKSRRATAFVLGIVNLSLWFFLWVGLLSAHDLSRIFPFAGLSPALVAVGAWLFLKEHLSGRAWAGVALITVGIVLVSVSK